MSKTFIAIAAALAVASSEGTAAKYAVVCDGVAQTTNTIPRAGKLGTKSEPLRHAQTYVIDEAVPTVRKALPPLRTFEDVCSLAGARQTVTISPDVVRADASIVIGQPPPHKCHFAYEPATGRAEWSIRSENDTGQTHEWKWIMRCRRGAIPVFNPPERGF